MIGQTQSVVENVQTVLIILNFHIIIQIFHLRHLKYVFQWVLFLHSLIIFNTFLSKSGAWPTQFIIIILNILQLVIFEPFLGLYQMLLIQVESEHESRPFLWLWDEIKVASICLYYLFWNEKSKSKFAGLLFVFLVTMRIEHLEHLFLIFFLDTHTGILHYENYLLLDGVVVNIYEHMAFLGVLNGVRYNIQCHLQHPLLVTYHLLWQNLISVEISHVF